MWLIKILKGPNAGETFQLSSGDTLIGRGNHCGICLPTPGISKEHARLSVSESGIYITDLNSTNGTFVNGIKIQRQALRITDKITIFNTMISLEKMHEIAPRTILPENIYPTHGNQALQFEVSPEMHHQLNPVLKGKPTLLTLLQNYINEVMLPGVYKLAEIMEFKWVLGILILAFIFVVTLLSVMPMIALTKASVQQESQRRALSLARSLSDKYAQAIKDGVDSTFSGSTIEREDGVYAAYIISTADGSVIAPARKIGQRPDEPFISKARKNDQQIVSQINDSLIGASVPIKVFDRDSGSFKTTSDAIILYDMGSLAVDNGRTVSLFVQVLAIAMVVGAFLFFFLFKLVEYPLQSLNKQINQALKDGQTRTQSSYLYPILQDLIVNINTALQRAGQSYSTKNVEVDRNTEALRLIENYPSAALALDQNQNVITMNLKFEEIVGARLPQIQGQNYSQFSDQALILNLKEMLLQAGEPNFSTQSAQLEFSGKNFKLNVQPILSEQGVSYFLITLIDDQPSGGF